MSLLEPGPRQILIAGADALGCKLAARLADAGHAVDLLARGSTLAALRSRGLQLDDCDGHWQAPVRPVASTAECATPDLELLCSKSHDLPDLAGQVSSVLGLQSLVVPLVNGVPFWYYQGAGGRFEGRCVHAVDPAGRLARLLPAASLLGAVTFLTGECEGPGRARAPNPHLLMMGEPSGGISPRLQAQCGLFSAAGIEARPQERLRDKLWIALHNGHIRSYDRSENRCSNDRFQSTAAIGLWPLERDRSRPCAAAQRIRRASRPSARPALR